MFKILIVDDEREIVENLENILKNAFGEAEILVTGISRQALEIVNTDVIDVLLTDIRMPGVNGFELSQAARESNPLCKIIFLTGYSDFDYAYTALKQGCDDFILKTNTDAEVLAALGRVIGEVREEKEQQELLHRAQTVYGMQSGDAQEDTSGVEFVKRYIWEHIDRHISLGKLAEMVYLNPAYLSRIFKSATGYTVTEFLTLVRMERSKQLLVDTNRKVQDIALAVGIDSPVYFGRMFKKKTGLTPQEFRSRYYGVAGEEE
ncbi:MAG: response regulator [Oscillospiraceae bacterium]